MICPNCQIDSVIGEQHYGALYTCNACRAVYFINFEGQPEFGEAPAALEEVIGPEIGSTEAVSAVEEISSEKNSLFADVAQNITDFGNTETQLAGLNYNLKIIGLDTQEIKQLFQEAIADSKFGWDASEIMKNIKNGQVQFEKLNPAKAYILAKRLQFLDIEKHWQQNAMS